MTATTESSQTILLVEDDAASRRLVRALLRPYGYRLFETDSLDGARRLLSEHHPSLVLLDIRLTDGTGLDLAREIRAGETRERIPIIALTAQALKEDVAQILEFGIDRYIPKPFDTRLLVNTVNELINVMEHDLER